MSLFTSLRPRHAFIGVAALAAAAYAHAQLAFNVTFDTSKLVNASGAPFYLDFQLNDGAGVGDANNTVTLSHFSFGTGSASASASTSGGASGSLNTTVTLKDTAAFNELYQAFTPGSTLTFTISSTDVFTNAIPDAFSFAVLDNTLSNIPTSDPGLTDAFAILDIKGPNSTVLTFAEDNSIPLESGGAALHLATPTIAPIPEPGTYGLIGAVALASIAFTRRRRRSAA